ncbi:MAG: hypothetical protein ACOZAM_15185 [Pseudomonadota bacterium]
MTRARLDNRRPCEHIDFQHGDTKATVTVGFRVRDRGDILVMEASEIFMRSQKAGSDAEAEARDAGIAISLAMQSGVSLGDLQHSVTRTDTGEPATMTGAALDTIVKTYG